MGKDYDTEKIWERINSSVDLRKLKKAKTDKERFEVFEKALAKDPRTKNLLKPRAFLRKNLRKIYNRVLAKEVAQGEKGVQKSLKRFSEPRRNEILRFSREQKIDTLQDNIIRKAELKGFEIKEVKTNIIKSNVTISRYKLRGKNVIAIYQKGKRGSITLEYL